MCVFICFVLWYLFSFFCLNRIPLSVGRVLAGLIDSPIQQQQQQLSSVVIHHAEFSDNGQYLAICYDDKAMIIR